MRKRETDKAPTAEFEALKSYSARIGADALQIQGAGGNTSLKHNDVLWVKASGKWLINATQEDSFVPVQHSALMDAFRSNDVRAEKATDFIIHDLNPLGLRPSIETTLHALLEFEVVVHVHCVDTIAMAVLQDAEREFGRRLAAFNWAFIPYIRPGLPLSRSIEERLQADTDVLVLGNHGLVVAAHSVDACGEKLDSVRRAIHGAPRSVSLPPALIGVDNGYNTLNKEFASLLNTGDNYKAAQHPEAHLIAFDETGLRVAGGGSLYPDHVIFLGAGSVIAEPGEDCVAVLNRCAAQGVADPVSIIFPGVGVAMCKTANAGQQAMARCLSDVCRRVPARATVNYLNERQNHELLNWEAEQYRQVLNQTGMTLT